MATEIDVPRDCYDGALIDCPGCGIEPPHELFHFGTKVECACGDSWDRDQSPRWVTLQLPRLVSGRDLAKSMVAGLGNLTDHPTAVILDCRGLASGTGSFAAQLVASILRDGGAIGIDMWGAPLTFRRYLMEAATKLDVANRIGVRT